MALNEETERKLNYYCTKCGAQVIEHRGKFRSYCSVTGESLYHYKARCPQKKHWWDGHFGGFSPRDF